MNYTSLEQLRHTTERYSLLQGLKVLPYVGALLLWTAAGPLFESLPAIGRPFLLQCLLSLPLLAGAIALHLLVARPYYKRRFGVAKNKRLSRKATLLFSVVVVSAIFGPPVLFLVGPHVIRSGIFAMFIGLGGTAFYMLVLCGVFMGYAVLRVLRRDHVLAALPLLIAAPIGLTSTIHDDPLGSAILAAAGLISFAIVGLLDHRYLVRTLSQPVQV